MTKKTKLGANIIELEYRTQSEMWGLHDDIELIIKDNKVVFNKGNSYSVDNHGSDWDTSLTNIPDDYSWQLFSQTLDELDVWKWKKNYHSKHEFFDGGRWCLNITKNSKKLECHGDIDKPSNFNDFLEALNKLMRINMFELYS